MDNNRVNNGRKMDSFTPNANRRVHSSHPPVENVILTDNKALAMAYVPWQHWQEVYCLERALGNGTLFPELNKPFTRGAR